MHTMNEHDTPKTLWPESTPTNDSDENDTKMVRTVVTRTQQRVFIRDILHLIFDGFGCILLGFIHDSSHRGDCRRISGR